MLKSTELTTAEIHALNMLVDGTSGDAEVEAAFVRSLLTGLRIFKERQKKYGRANIARRGAEGVVIRLGDKLSRLEHLRAGVGVGDESVEDTWIDVGNYGFIGLMAECGEWPT